MFRPLLRYYLLDVFTATPLSGNPLAVFLEAEGLETEVMQAIANELNLSETIFIGKREKNSHFSIRIFAPDRELPFAGHPVIGAAHLLMAQENIDRSTPLRLESPIGPLTVRFDSDLARLAAAKPAENDVGSMTRTEAAQLFGVDVEAVIDDPAIGSCGLPYHLVPLGSRKWLSRALPDASKWRALVSSSGIEQVYLYVLEGGEIEARMFTVGPGGLYEDPATGSAAAALAGYLGERSASSVNDWRIQQGADMGRPSEILVYAYRDDTARVQVEISGRAVIVGEGALYPWTGRRPSEAD